MPQLNPNPWFMIMILSWLTLSLIMQPKLLSFLSPNPLHTKQITAHKTQPWTWPWT
uniref:ATP synthase complex subunit 8 n=1 Tax=Heliornis fulica TaxID=54369 RepID=A0A096X6U0_9GRUI|nr:ATP synthase F0 subunit 8 [Heliornis fulica]AHA13334.1 ATP synthase F0 subunit 8 [Heliornis fulica]QOD97617.1 ATP synthase F0 subunit 8 [Heliornis fulica]